MILRKRLLVGVQTGLGVALLFSVIAGVSYATGGAHTRARIGLPYWNVVLLYLWGGASGGLIAGALLSFVTSQWRAMALGCLATLPMFLAAIPSMLPRAEWYPPGVTIALIVSVVVGGGWGAMAYYYK